MSKRKSETFFRLATDRKSQSRHTEFREVSLVDGSKQVNTASKDLPEVSQKLCLVEPGKTAGRLKLYFPDWQELTFDPQILKASRVLLLILLAALLYKCFPQGNRF